LLTKAIKAHEADLPKIMERIFHHALNGDAKEAAPYLTFVAARIWPQPKPTENASFRPLQKPSIQCSPAFSVIAFVSQ
jgi:hypothetical protein